jgi:hypothetical protein
MVAVAVTHFAIETTEWHIVLAISQFHVLYFPTMLFVLESVVISRKRKMRRMALFGVS